jgi:hypothetical protein
MTQAPEETEVKGGVWMTPEDYAALMKISVELVKKMLNPKAKKPSKMFDRRDVKRFSRNHSRIFVTRPNAAGISSPRLVER